MINSIGVRRDAAAVDLLSSRLADKDAEVASASAVALGRVGNPAAAQSLRKALTAGPAAVRSAVAEGLVLCAERYLAESNSAEATKIYDEVRKAEVPRQRMLEATRGAILARGKDGIPLLVEQLRSNDKGLFQIALGTAREFSPQNRRSGCPAKSRWQRSQAGTPGSDRRAGTYRKRNLPGAIAGYCGRVRRRCSEEGQGIARRSSGPVRG
ncbi:MAG: HEAT repeat domain-containing protein [Planctomycetia bacterium]|nr:HEAT repeat domain-containing protein [Planctomycetia bacterium]